MSAPSLESLFERYRAEGDLAAMAAVFDRTAPQLLALAAHLVRDPVEAEDLVQGTFLAAIEGARSFDRERRLEAWLAGILVRQAQRVRRERGRRADPQLLAREPEPEPAHAAEQRELAREVEEALATLEEPYRSVLAQHLRGERPLDIARASGRAPGTVRMQILRGLERLRRVLPAGLYALAPGRAPRGMAEIRAEVMRQGTLAAGAGTAAAAVATVGGISMMVKALVAGLAACGLALVAFVRSERGAAQELAAPQAQAEVALAPAGAAPAVEPPAVATLEAARVAQAPVAVAAERTAPSAPERSALEQAKPNGIWLVGRLQGVAEDPAAVEVRVANGHGTEVNGTGTPEGTYAVDLTDLVHSWREAPSFFVTATHPSGLRAQVELPVPDEVRAVEATRSTKLTMQTGGVEREIGRMGGPTTRTEVALDLELRPCTAVVGRVDVEGIERTSVRVALVPEDPGAGPWTEGACAADGRFALFPPQGGRFRLVAHGPGFLPNGIVLDAPFERVTDAGTLRLDARGVAIEGRLAFGFELPGAGPHVFRVRAQRQFAASAESHELFESVLLTSEGVQASAGSARAGADGAFRIEGLEAGTYALTLEREESPLSVLPFHPMQVAAPARDVELGRDFGLLRVVVTGAAERVRVGFEMRGSSVTVTQNVDQPVQVIADRRAALTIGARAPGFSDAKVESPALTRAVVEEVALALVPGTDDSLAALEIEWTLPAGAVAPEWVRALWARDHTTDGRTVHATDEKAARATASGCRFTEFQPGRYRILLDPSRQSWDPLASELCAASFEVELHAGRTTLARVAWERGGRARFVPDAGGRMLDSMGARVVDALGAEQQIRFTQREFRDGSVHSGSWSGSIPLFGPCEMQPNLPPGAYALVLTDGDSERLRVPFLVVAGEVVDVPFVVP